VGFVNNAGTVTYPFTLSSAGAVACLGALTLTNINFAGIRIITGLGTGLLNFTDATQTVGVGIDVATDATLKIRTRAQTADASLTALNITASGVADANTASWGTVSAKGYLSYDTGKVLIGASSASTDVVFIRNSNAEIARITSLGAFSAGSIRGTAVAFASVPATPVEGMLVAVTDSSTATWGATITGGGANHVLAFFNGTNWTVAGK